MSPKGPSDATIELVKVRDGGRCARCGLFVTNGRRGIDWSVHHRRPRGSGGTSLAWVNLPANLVLLCGSGTTGCHAKVEKDRAAARDLGFLVPLNGRRTAAEIPIHHVVLGIVRLRDDGTYRKEVRPCLATSDSS